MPSVASQKSAPSHLGVVLRQVAEVFGAAADATPIMVGKRYLEHFGTGSAPRVLFVPEPRGKFGDPIEMGNPCSFTHSCDVYVRGAESGDDISRFDAAYELGDLVASEIARATTGRRGTETNFVDDSPADVDAYGADLAFSFTYRRDVRWATKIVAVAAADADNGTPVPTGPAVGIPAATVAINVTDEPE